MNLRVSMLALALSLPGLAMAESVQTFVVEHSPYVEAALAEGNFDSSMLSERSGFGQMSLNTLLLNTREAWQALKTKSDAKTVKQTIDLLYIVSATINNHCVGRTNYINPRCFVKPGAAQGIATLAKKYPAPALVAKCDPRDCDFINTSAEYSSITIMGRSLGALAYRISEAK